jgi:hypothetical protein
MATASGLGRSNEPSWHRRARRVRSGHRLLAQVTAACINLADHHGSYPPAVLRPLLDALIPRAPLPRDVPWPTSLTTPSAGSPSVVIPSVVLEAGLFSSSTSPDVLRPPYSIPHPTTPDLRPPPDVLRPPTSDPHPTPSVLRPPNSALRSPHIDLHSSSTLRTGVPAASIRVLSGGDFRSLPCGVWQSIHLPFSPNQEHVELMCSTVSSLLARHKVKWSEIRAGPNAAHFAVVYENAFALCERAISEIPHVPPSRFGAYINRLTCLHNELHDNLDATWDSLCAHIPDD